MTMVFTREARMNWLLLVAGQGGGNLTVDLFKNNVTLTDTTVFSAVPMVRADYDGYASYTSDQWSAPAVDTDGSCFIISPVIVFTRPAFSALANTIYGYYISAPLPGAGTQTLTLAGSGDFTLSVAGVSTGTLHWNSPAADIQTALQSLAVPFASYITVTGSGPFTITIPAPIHALGNVQGTGAGMTSLGAWAASGTPTTLILGMESLPTPISMRNATDQVPLRIKLIDRQGS